MGAVLMSGAAFALADVRAQQAAAGRANVTATYHGELCAAMQLLARQPNAVFLGQAVAVDGTTMAASFRDIPPAQRLELPVAEDMQMGMAIGMALGGYLPVCVFPRWNFVLCAANQLVNHLDRLPLYSSYRPKVIIRTAVPSTKPFNPGPQHDDDFSQSFYQMLRTVKIVRLISEAMIVPEYRKAVERDSSTILVEFTDKYKDERGHAKNA